MSPSTQPLAVAFANTLSSTGRDRIATLEGFRDWAATWPAFDGMLARLPASAVAGIRAQRDATQLLLHRLADRDPLPGDLLARATRPGLTAAPFRLLPTQRGVLAANADASTSIEHLLGRAVVDLLLSPHLPELRRCSGTRCRKVFLAHRADRRWCDSRICGNRARVAAHAARHRPD